MTQAVQTSIDRHELAALLDARHADIFSVLGMHRQPGGSGLLVRCLQPGASSVTVVDKHSGKDVAVLDCTHESGFFEGKLGRRRKPFHYFLRVSYPDAELEIEDCYRFASQLNENDLYLFCEGTQERAYHFLGSHPLTVDGVDGVNFAVWAPNASRVSVVGDFNHWDGRRHAMRKHPAAGVWEIFVPALQAGSVYKYEIVSAEGTVLPLKADPFAFAMQHSPANASKVAAVSAYNWADSAWMNRRRDVSQQYQQPLSIYEVHFASWRRNIERDGAYLDYRELADQLIPYALEMGFTHLQLMPVSEFPFDGSWGYQPIGLYAPTSRFGDADAFRYFVDQCHRNDLGVLLDWVPGHFPTDEHGLGRFDGSCLYEHEDPKQGFHPDWNTLIYNYSRAEVVSFLLSNALYWLDEFHIDGLRVDAVASMLYLDYGREAGEWIPNQHGGRENLAAMEFLRNVNARAYFNHPGIMMIAEESTAWPGVTKAVDENGLGFGFKWNMGWMNDTLSYMERDPIHRKFHHNEMTFGLLYGFSENFILPLSHDEVVHGKKSLLSKMPGDDWQKFANLRAYFGFMYSHPGKKLLFMGGELAQRDEWNHDRSLDWHLLEHAAHAGIKQLVADLNRIYRDAPALHQRDCDADGFRWLQEGSAEQSVFAYMRFGLDGAEPALVVVNMTPNTYSDYEIGVPESGYYREIMNTDSSVYGGSNKGNSGGQHALHESFDGQPCKIKVCVPPLATLILLCETGKG
ncbi:MAG: 1,4-alpha-glucan branching protein GlgB [Pseudomonadales bacterium]|nr:1,4-alpha-glucan branching protein GlgB [Pseudomonadales bacterium]